MFLYYPKYLMVIHTAYKLWSWVISLQYIKEKPFFTKHTFLVIWHHPRPVPIGLLRDNCNLNIWIVMIWMIGSLVLTQWNVGATCECGASQNHLPQHKGMIRGSAGIGRIYTRSYTFYITWENYWLKGSGHKNFSLCHSFFRSTYYLQ